MDAETGGVVVYGISRMGNPIRRILSDVKVNAWLWSAPLHKPRRKIIAFIFFGQYGQVIGSTCTCLVAPYLALHAAKIKVFHVGEG